MRIDRLVLERYGAFEHKTLEFDRSPFTIVFGPNEAGKSTCLSAIGDFLFRMPTSSPRVSRFGADAARIYITISAADGRRLELRRQYGRTPKTLSATDGTLCDEAVLGSLLGSTSRDRFENLFGLDHESLRAGGDALLSPDGDIGRLIVEAGGGLRTLVARLAAIEAEIDNLFAPRRKESRIFYRALSAYEEANKLVRAATLTHDAWDRDRKAREAATVALATIRDGKKAVAEELSGQRRLEKTIPHIRALDEVEARMAEYADVGHLGEIFVERCASAFANDQAATDALKKAEAAHSGVVGRIEAMIVDPALSALENELLDVASLVETVSGARKSRENRTVELAETEAKLAVLRERLGIGPDIKLQPLIPSVETLDDARDLLAREAAMTTTEQARRKAAAVASDAVEACSSRIATLAALGRDKPFGVLSASFSSFAAQRSAAEGKLYDAESAESDCAKRAASAGLPDPRQLRDLPWPAEDRLRAELKIRDAALAERIRLAGLLADASRQRDGALATLVGMNKGGPLANRETIAEARLGRDEVWLKIRADHVAGRSEAPSEQRLHDVATFEASMREADSLSDRRADEADKAAAAAEATRRAGEADATIAAVTSALRDCDERLAGHLQAFHEAFPDASKVQSDLAALLETTRSRADILSKLERAEAARIEGINGLRALEPLDSQLEAAERMAGLVPHRDDRPGARVQALAAAIDFHDAEHAEFKRESRELIALTTSANEAQRLIVEADKARGVWDSEWSSVVERLGAPAGSKIAAVAAIVNAWTGAAGYLNSLAITRRRLDRMDEDEAQLAKKVKDLAMQLCITVPLDPVAGATTLIERGSCNDKVRTGREALKPEVARAEEALEASRRDKVLTEATLAALRSEADAPNDAALRVAADRRRELTVLTKERAQTASAAQSAGDELSIHELRMRAEGGDLDRTRATIADLESRLQQLDADVEAAIRAETGAAAALAAHQGRTGSAAAIVQREVAAAGMHEAVERFVELTLARDLVEKAIQTVRVEQQDPLVRLAGTMFAAMTGGEFVGIEADVDAKGMPTVVGVKGNGTVRQSVPTMSDGTRDQLYLAFRLASLANYSAAAEPIPLIADDTLVHFDDKRSAATMELLADFSATTQVLLFTHHESVRDVGLRLAARKRAAVIELT